MQAFLNKKSIKTKYLNRVKSHQKNDEIIKKVYWTNGKGCAVGCTIHSSNHKAYETELGIPEWLAYVEDSLFEGMSIEKSKTWPFDFLNNIKIGVYLEKVKVPFQILILKKSLKILEDIQFKDINFPDVIKCIENSKVVVKELIHLWETRKINDESAARSAESAARSAARSAESTAWSAARSAEGAAWSAARSAESAAWSAARSAASTAWSAESAARSAARSAEGAAWSAARSAARSAASAASAAFDELADGLLEIIKNLK